eukprot:tig00000404_g378.t1
MLPPRAGITEKLNASMRATTNHELTVPGASVTPAPSFFAPSMQRAQVLGLYKSFLRTAQRVPVQRPRAKAVANIKEMFRFYMDEKDPAKITQLVDMGRHDLVTLTILADLKPELSDQIYKSDGFNR